jgi:ABC-2 type transport system permease protein
MYAALTAAGFRRYATYRQATVAGAFTNSVFGFLRCYVLLATTTALGGAVVGYSARQIATFVWVGRGLIATVQLWGGYEYAERIRSGEVMADLLRPVDLVWQQVAADLGRAAPVHSSPGWPRSRRCATSRSWSRASEEVVARLYTGEAR